MTMTLLTTMRLIVLIICAVSVYPVSSYIHTSHPIISIAKDWSSHSHSASTRTQSGSAFFAPSRPQPHARIVTSPIVPRYDHSGGKVYSCHDRYDDHYQCKECNKRVQNTDRPDAIRVAITTLSVAISIITMTVLSMAMPSMAENEFPNTPVLVTSKTVATSSDNSPTGQTSNNVVTSAASPQLTRTTAYDETWDLIKKYALDQTFHGQDWDEAYTTYSRGIDLSRNEDQDQDDVMKATRNLVSSLGDKYSRILDKEEYARIQKFDLIGVGATLMPDPITKEIIVGAPPVSKSASDMAGLKVGDVVVAVNGIKTAGRTAFDIIDQITEEDPRASTVTFSIRRDSMTSPSNIEGEPIKTKDYTMKREFLEVKDPISYRISETRSDGTKVGYIRIAEFNSLVKPSLEAALISLEAQGANAYVVDVRGNPGGAFQSAIEIAGLFMNDKLATDVVDGNGVDLKFRTSKDRVVVKTDHPLAVWVDSGSASASEVLAGALRDNCRAVVMGSTSFGKGLVQAVYGLNNGYGLVLTVAKYLTPGGTDINKVGIVPDISKEVALPSVPRFVPLVGSDTSRVDFKDVSDRMTMCLDERQ